MGSSKITAPFGPVRRATPAVPDSVHHASPLGGAEVFDRLLLVTLQEDTGGLVDPRNSDGLEGRRHPRAAAEDAQDQRKAQ